jgi:hypothetical protein
MCIHSNVFIVSDVHLCLSRDLWSCDLTSGEVAKEIAASLFAKGIGGGFRTNSELVLTSGVSPLL